MIKIFFTGVCLFVSMAMYAQDSSWMDSTVGDTDIAENDEPEYVDTTLTQYDFITNDDSIRNYGTPSDFPYMSRLDSVLKVVGKIPVDTVNLSEPVKAAKTRVQKERRTSVEFSISPGVRIILWIIAILFLLFILYKLFAGDHIFRRQAKALAVEPADEEKVEGNNYDHYVAQSVAKKNYRLAVRYLYLKTLHLLSLSDIIRVSAEKTNYQYIREMRLHKSYNEFAALTNNYEYVWYGKFNIDQPLYERLEKDFKQYFQSL